MKYIIIVTKQAKRDLVNIYEYIAYVLKSKASADKQIRKLETAISNLDIFPERFKRYESENNLQTEFRIMPVNNFNVYYIVKNDSREVAIIRIIYKKRCQRNVK